MYSGIVNSFSLLYIFIYIILYIPKERKKSKKERKGIDRFGNVWYNVNIKLERLEGEEYGKDSELFRL
jgi:hypothetical protein